VDSAGLLARFALAALAVWRVAHLLAHEDGPGDLVLRLRLALGAVWELHRYPDGGETEQWVGNGFWGKLIICPLCLSVWLAMPAALWVVGPVPDAVVVWLALTGAASYLEVVVDR